MGASFVLGSLFTLFLLLVLDFVRRGNNENNRMITRKIRGFPVPHNDRHQAQQKRKNLALLLVLLTLIALVYAISMMKMGGHINNLHLLTFLLYSMPDPHRKTAWRDGKALLEAMRATPGDGLPWGVYADWLEEHGDTEKCIGLRAVQAAFGKLGIAGIPVPHQQRLPT